MTQKECDRLLRRLKDGGDKVVILCEDVYNGFGPALASPRMNSECAATSKGACSMSKLMESAQVFAILTPASKLAPRPSWLPV